VWNVLRAQQVKGGRNIAIYWDSGIRLEAGVESDAPFTQIDDIVRSATPSGPTVHAIHFGAYAELARTHAAIQEWSQHQGHRLAGPRWEIYGHWRPEWNESPSEIRTDVFYQVARR
jgi:effector-binding domain-containing protein